MGSEPAVRVQATIKEALPNALFQVEMENGRRVLAHIAESFRMHVVRLLPGEEVTLELSPHDGRRGRIVSRAGPASRAAAPSGRKESES